jgi:hypothetical protein
MDPYPEAGEFSIHPAIQLFKIIFAKCSLSSGFSTKIVINLIAF